MRAALFAAQLAEHGKETLSLGPEFGDCAREPELALGRQPQVANARVAGGELAA